MELQRALATPLAESVQELQVIPMPETDSTLSELIAAATESVPGAQHAGIIMATRRGTGETVSSTDPLAVVLDDIQRRHAEGPCLSAAWLRNSSGSATCRRRAGGRAIAGMPWRRSQFVPSCLSGCFSSASTSAPTGPLKC